MTSVAPLPPSAVWRRRLAWLGTLKFRILAGSVVGALAASFVTAHYALETGADRATRTVLDQHAQVGERSAQHLSASVRLLHDVLMSASSRLDAARLADADLTRAYLVDRLVVHDLFDSAFIARADGTMLVRTERGVPSADLPHIREREYYARLVRTGLPVVSLPVLGRASGTALVVLVVPVRERGELIGLMGGALRLDSPKFPVLPDVSDAPGNVTDFVIAADGTVLAHADPRRVAGHARDEPGFARAYARWRDNGATVHAEGTAVISEDRIVSMAGVPGADWMLVRLTPWADAMAPIDAARAVAWRAAAGVAAAAAALAALFAWLVARPIVALRRRATRLLEPDWGGDAPWPPAAGEVGELSLALRQVVAIARTREAETERLLRRLQAVLDNATVGVVITRADRFELASRQFCTMMGYRVEQIVGRTTRIVHPDDSGSDELDRAAGAALRERGAYEAEHRLMRCDGSVFWARVRGRPIDTADRGAGTIWIVEDVTQTRAQRKHLAYAATHDTLTGLRNRAAFERALEAANTKARAEPFCALFIDLDRFKLVNDTSGHEAGDRLLQDLANVLRRVLRRGDAIARLGGDEFAVMLADASLEQALPIAEKLRAAVEDHRLEWKGRSHGVGASIGLVHVRGQYAGIADILRAADAACYAAKQGGRNAVRADPTGFGELDPGAPR